MNVFKKITLILLMAFIAFPAYGMDADDGNQGFFGRLWNTAKEHPVAAVSIVGTVGIGIWLFNQIRQYGPVTREQLEAAREQLEAHRAWNKDFHQEMEDGIFQNRINVGPAVTRQYLTEAKARFAVSVSQAYRQKTVKELKLDKRVMAILCLLKSKELPVIFPRDIRNKIMSYFPEYVLNKSHCEFLLWQGVGIEQLIEYCPISWFKQIYKETSSECQKVILEQLVQYKLDELRKFLMAERTKKLIADAPHVFMGRPISPEVSALLDPNNVEQHREAIERNVRAAFVGDANQADINNNNNE